MSKLERRLTIATSTLGGSRNDDMGKALSKLERRLTIATSTLGEEGFS
ncbi:MAG: hypothetical protein IKD80_07815 [Selenomonadaceae bacterium]|nr:hypothetical protein [Selenomonadaceae bacterium]